MANRQLTVAVLVGMVVGFLMGAGALRYAELTADMLIARTDFVKRSQRTNEIFFDQGIQNPGVPDARNEERTEDTRTEKGITAAGIARGCLRLNLSEQELSDCLSNAIEKALNAQEGN